MPTFQNAIKMVSVGLDKPDTVLRFNDDGTRAVMFGTDQEQMLNYYINVSDMFQHTFKDLGLGRISVLQKFMSVGDAQPSIKQEEEKLILKSARASLKFTLTSPEFIAMPGNGEVNVFDLIDDDPESSAPLYMNITSEWISEFQKYAKVWTETKTVRASLTPDKELWFTFGNDLTNEVSWCAGKMDGDDQRSSHADLIGIHNTKNIEGVLKALSYTDMEKGIYLRTATDAPELNLGFFPRTKEDASIFILFSEEM